MWLIFGQLGVRPVLKNYHILKNFNKIMPHKNVEVLLVSLDFPRQYETKLIPFIQKNKLKSRVVAFDDTDQNRWIPAIDRSLVRSYSCYFNIQRDKRQFYERSFTYEE